MSELNIPHWSDPEVPLVYTVEYSRQKNMLYVDRIDYLIAQNVTGRVPFYDPAKPVDRNLSPAGEKFLDMIAVKGEDRKVIFCTASEACANNFIKEFIACNPKLGCGFVGTVFPPGASPEDKPVVMEAPSVRERLDRVVTTLTVAHNSLGSLVDPVKGLKAAPGKRAALQVICNMVGHLRNDARSVARQLREEVAD